MIVRPVGDRALLVEVDDAWSALATARLVRDLARSDGGLPTPRDVVPAARTVLLDGLRDLAGVLAWRVHLTAVRPEELPDAEATSGRVVVVDTTYDGADLAVVARAWGCSPEAVAERHQQTEYLVAFCGFAPGFAYCVPTQPLPQVRRRDAPRERVPHGSVGLADVYCGIYPREMPGGWQLVGRTEAVLFDPALDMPALLVPGDRVRFRSMP